MDPSLTTNNSCSINCCQLINCEKTINEPTLEQHRKQNFRQLLRSLREDETDDSGPLLASSEDQIGVADDEGFTVFHRHKKNRKSKNVQNGEGNVDMELTCNNSDQNELINTNVNDEALRFDSSVQKIETQNSDPRSDEICLGIEELKMPEKTITTDDTKKKRTWLNTSHNNSTRTIDFGECPICYRAFSNDKIILEECGHCFHSECIRLWMKQKNTCPFCAGYSLLPEEFPRLT